LHRNERPSINNVESFDVLVKTFNGKGNQWRIDQSVAGGLRALENMCKRGTDSRRRRSRSVRSNKKFAVFLVVEGDKV
jgi:hypothetical protein